MLFWARDILPAGFVAGFAAALVMWCVWFLTHLPGLRIPTAWAGPILLITLFGAVFASVRHAPGGSLTDRAGPGVLTGLFAGLTAAGLNLLLIGSKLTEQPAPVSPAEIGAAEPVGTLVPAAGLVAGGFLIAGGVIGALAGLAATLRPRCIPGALATPARRRSTLAVVAAVAIAPLLLIGGLVTSTESGMAVPDWPGTFGANMFLYPIGLMAHPRIFLEHTHRLFGSLAGLNALAVLVVALSARGLGRGGQGEGWRSLAGVLVLLAGVGVALIAQQTERLGTPVFLAIAAAGFALALLIAAAGTLAARLKWGAAAVFALVTIQGMLGGVRVTANDQLFALAHGVGGQLVFAASVALAAAMLPRAPSEEARPNRAALWCALALVALFMQLVLGAAFRHMASAHALWTHAGFSILVVVFVVIAAFAMMGAGTRAGALLHRVGGGIVACVAVQFMLGWGALLMVLGGADRGPVPTHDRLAEAVDPPVMEVLLATAHQANGALLLALVTFGGILAHRAARPAPAMTANAHH